MGIHVGQFLRGKGSGDRGDVLVTNSKNQGSTLKSLKYLANHKFPKKLKIFGLQGKKQCKGEYKTGFKQHIEEGPIQKSTLGPTIRKKKRHILA